MKLARRYRRNLSVCSLHRHASRRANMRGRLLVMGASVCLSTFSCQIGADPIYWTGDDGDWSAVLNWSLGHLPGALDDVFNNTSHTITHSTGNDVINSFQSDGEFLLTGGSLSGHQDNSASTIQVNNQFIIDGGTLSNFTVNAGSKNGIPYGVTFTGNASNAIDNVIFSCDVSLGSGFVDVLGSNQINQRMNLSGGEVRLREDNNNNGALILNSGSKLEGYGTVVEYFGGGVLTNNGTIEANGNGQTLSFVVDTLTNNSTIQTSNSGNLEISGTLTNAGQIEVQAGATLAAANMAQTAGSTLVNGNLSVQSGLQLLGGTLSGKGSVTGVVNNTGGDVRPGDLLGTLQIAGNYTQSANGKLEIGLAGLTQGVTYDLLKVNSLASLAGELDVKLLNGFVPTVGETFDFLTYGSRTGAFDSLVAMDSGVTYSLSYNDGTGIGTLTVDAVTSSVPETSTLLSAALILATGGILLHRRRSITLEQTRS